MNAKFTTTILLASSCLLLAACAKKGQMDQPQQAPAPPVAAAPAPVAPVAPPAEPLRLERIHFEYDSYVLTPAARAILARNAQALKAEPARKLVIEGHCDERGSDEYNLALGEKRARAAMKYLVDLGVAANRISVVSYGEEKPLAPGQEESAWSKNRRAEML